MGDVVYYFSQRVTRDAKRLISKKLALLWTGPYQVVRKPGESLATIKPLGHWARGDQELTTTVDKLRVVQGLVPEDRLGPRVQIRLDELEEDLDNYGEYVQAEGEAEGLPLPGEFLGNPAGGGGPQAEPKGENPLEGRGNLEAGEAPRGEQLGEAEGYPDPRRGARPYEAEATGGDGPEGDGRAPELPTARNRAPARADRNQRARLHRLGSAHPAQPRPAARGAEQRPTIRGPKPGELSEECCWPTPY